eukprot:Hpha_TRINITY_DN34437_c0_g1::TRINITY_DN34437_c0_g1_i1::g.96198::m.96198
MSERHPLYNGADMFNREPHHVSDWNVNELMMYLRRQNWCNPNLIARFAAHRIDGAALLELTEQELRKDFFVSSRQGVQDVLVGIRTLASDPAPTRTDTPSQEALNKAHEAALQAGMLDAPEDSVPPPQDEYDEEKVQQELYGEEEAAADDEEIYDLERVVQAKLERLDETNLQISDRERRRLVKLKSELEGAGADSELIAAIDGQIEQAVCDANPNKVEEAPASPSLSPVKPEDAEESQDVSAQPNVSSVHVSGVQIDGLLSQSSDLWLPSEGRHSWKDFAALQQERAAAVAELQPQQRQDAAARSGAPADLDSKEDFSVWLTCGMPPCVTHLVPPRGHVGRGSSSGLSPEQRQLRRKYKLAAKRREWLRQHGVWVSEKRSRLWKPGLLEEARRHSELTELARGWDRSEEPEGEGTGRIIFWNVILALQTFFYWSDEKRDAVAEEEGVEVDSKGCFGVQ